MTDHAKAIELLRANGYCDSAVALEKAAETEEALKKCIGLWRFEQARSKRLQAELNDLKPLTNPATKNKRGCSATVGEG